MNHYELIGRAVVLLAEVAFWGFVIPLLVCLILSSLRDKRRRTP